LAAGPTSFTGIVGTVWPYKKVPEIYPPPYQGGKKACPSKKRIERLREIIMVGKPVDRDFRALAYTIFKAPRVNK